MKINTRITYFCFATIMLLSGCGVNKVSPDGTNTVILSTESEVIEKKATREYFENVDKSYTIDDIVKEIGNPFKVTGSGISTYHWNLEEGGAVRVKFASDGIMTIYFYKEGEDAEKIYTR